MNKRISLGAAIAFAIIVAAAVFSMTMTYAQQNFNQRVNNLKERELMMEKYTELDRRVRDNYIGTINETQLLDSVARGYLDGIGDPYAMYISAEEYARIDAQNVEGENVGIGVVVEANPEGYLLITEVYPDSPAQIAGIVAGDLIIRIEEVDLTPENVDEDRGALYGAPGTSVTLTVRSGAADRTETMARRAVTVPTVYSNMIADTDVGYIWIKEFSNSTSDQFNRELDRLLNAGAHSLVFDLRDNKGGVMRQATRILDKLVPAGIIYTAERKDGTVETVTSDANEIDLPMVVLVNNGTASAAELFAQVLKDYDKARIIGTVTSGKGVMQDIINLSDGSAVQVTVAYYNPPISPNFNEVGVLPDYEVTMDEDWTQIDQAYDAQLERALEVVEAMRRARETQQAEAEAEASQSEAEEIGQEEDESSIEEPAGDAQE